MKAKGSGEILGDAIHQKEESNQGGGKQLPKHTKVTFSEDVPEQPPNDPINQTEITNNRDWFHKEEEDVYLPNFENYTIPTISNEQSLSFATNTFFCDLVQDEQESNNQWSNQSQLQISYIKNDTSFDDERQYEYAERDDDYEDLFDIDADMWKQSIEYNDRRTNTRLILIEKGTSNSG